MIDTRDDEPPQAACLMSEFCDSFCMFHKITRVDLNYAGKFHCPHLLSRTRDTLGLAPIVANLHNCYGRNQNGWNAIYNDVRLTEQLPMFLEEDGRWLASDAALSGEELDEIGNG